MLVGPIFTMVVVVVIVGGLVILQDLDRPPKTPPILTMVTVEVVVVIVVGGSAVLGCPGQSGGLKRSFENRKYPIYILSLSHLKTFFFVIANIGDVK